MLINMLRQAPDDGAGTGTESASAGLASDASGNAPANSPAASAEGAVSTSPAFAERIPQDYRDKPYIQELLKNQDPEVEFFKQFDNLQQALGKPKVGVPAADAPQEDWDKFYALMRPEAPDKYEMPDPDFGENKDLAQIIKDSRDPEFIKSMQQAAFDNGVHPKAFAAMVKAYEAQSGDFIAQQRQAQMDMEKSFEESTTKAFGGDKDKALTYAQGFLTEHLTPEIKAMLPNMSNESLLMAAALAKSVRQKYEKEDSITQTPSSADALNTREKVLEQYRLVAAEMYAMKPGPERDAKKEELNALREKASKLGPA